MNQLSIFDYGIKPPEAWACYKTCKNYGKIMGHFPCGGARCEFGYSQDLNPIIQEVNEHSVVHFYCKYYQFKEK